MNTNQNLIMTKTITDLIEVKNPRVAGRYLKKKVAMGHFIEDYIAEKVIIKVTFMELLKYKNDIFTFNFTAQKSFVLCYYWIKK